MSEYLPFGKSIKLTESEQSRNNTKFSLYEFYGIPYGYFDYEEDTLDYSRQSDINQARTLINLGEPIPEDLSKRLLEYKSKNKPKINHCE